MLYLEDHVTIEQDKFVPAKFTYKSITTSELLKSIAELYHYEPKDIMYSIQKICQSSLVGVQLGMNSTKNELPVYTIIDITMDGHDFIEAIENKTIWETTKRRAIKIGGASLKALVESAKFLITLAMQNPDTFKQLPEFMGLA